MIFGYARVSTQDQNLDAQLDALKAAGAEKIFKEKITGKTKNRPQLDKLLEQLRADDVVIVTKYDRLARSLKDLIMIVEAIRERGAGFKSLGEDIDTTTSAGRLVFHVFGSIAEFERERIAERTREGLNAARSRGRVGGRPRALSTDQREEVRQMRDKDNRPISEIARLCPFASLAVLRTRSQIPGCLSSNVRRPPRRGNPVAFFKVVCRGNTQRGDLDDFPSYLIV